MFKDTEKGSPLLHPLLVDGYDEVGRRCQRRVSEAIQPYQGHRAGKFYLTCRDYYEVSQLNASEVRIDAFMRLLKCKQKVLFRALHTGGTVMVMSSD